VLGLWLLAAGPVLAAEPATIVASAEAGYSRLVLTFPDRQLLPGYSVDLTNGVLVVRFDEEVAVDVAPVPVALPGLVSVARVDPDGTGVRLGLTREARVNTLEAGERLFIDLLPPDWVGLPPGLPPAVVAELAARAEAATRAAQAAARASGAVLPGDAAVEVRVGRAPDFTRIVFGWSVPFEASFTRGNGIVAVSFDQQATADLTELRVDPPPHVTGATGRIEDGHLIVELAVDPAADVRGYRDGDTYVVDVLGLDAGSPVAAPVAAVEAAFADPAAPPPGATGLVTAPGTGAATPPVAPAAVIGIPEDEVEQTPPPAEPALRAASEPSPPAPQPIPVPFAAVDPTAPVEVTAERVGTITQLSFPFAAPTPAAVFQRGPALWLVFDSAAPVDEASLDAALGGLATDVTSVPLDGGTAFRIALAAPSLAAAAAEGTRWVVSIGDTVLAPTASLTLERTAGAAGTALRVAFGPVGRIRAVTDPVLGDRLLVATGEGPARGLLGAQRFAELEALSSLHGIAVAPTADGIVMRADEDYVAIGREGGGLALSAGPDIAVAAAELPPAQEETAAASPAVAEELAPPAPTTTPIGFQPPPTAAAAPLARALPAPDPARFWSRRAALEAGAAGPDAAARSAARFELARLFLANGLGEEASGMLDLAAAEFPTDAVKPEFRLARAAASVLAGRPEEALAALDSPALAASGDAAFWRTLATIGQGEYAAADAAFALAEPVLAAYPRDLAVAARLGAARAALELGHSEVAAGRLAALPRLAPGSPAAAEADLLAGRVAEADGRADDARALYASAAARGSAAVPTEARLRATMLDYAAGRLDAAAALDRLEGLAFAWRGDATELAVLTGIADLAVETGNYRRAFEALRSAELVDRDARETVALEGAMQDAFADLFLDGAADALPLVEALALYYDFRELTPVSSRGDAMVRALAGRLVAADLLDQAEELLTYQIDNRVTGVARAQVAADLAAVYLLDGQPDAALLALNRSRLAGLPAEIERQRRLVEAEALSGTGQTALAIEVLAPLSGPQIERQRAEILWRGRSWQGAAEAYERLLAGRATDPRPLTEDEQLDVVRAAIAYVFSGDRIGLDRLQTAFAGKMAETANAATFRTIAAATSPTSGDVVAAASQIAALDASRGFLAEYRARYLAPSPGRAA